MPTKRPNNPNQDHQQHQNPLEPALALIPRGLFIMTAAYDGRRLGLRVHFVQIAATNPPSVAVALPKGEPISPLIRDSRAFGLCITAEDDRSIARRFATTPHHDNQPHHDDPFHAFEPYTLETGSPLLPRAAACLDCRVTMHLDVETDHELYIAEVVNSKLPDQPKEPAVQTGPEA